MNKFVSFMIVIVMIISMFSFAMADLPITMVTKVDNKTVAWYPNDWQPNFDGSHTQADVRSGKVTTIACEYIEVTIDDIPLRVCPVCGDINGEKMPLAWRAVVNRMFTGNSSKVATALIGSTNKRVRYDFLTNGQYMVRIFRMPEESSAAYIISICHEIGGIAYDAECPYSFIIPVDGRNLTVKKAYFGGLIDVKHEAKILSNGLYLKFPSDAFGVYVLMK